jgi:hypothetical protein
LATTAGKSRAKPGGLATTAGKSRAKPGGLATTAGKSRAKPGGLATTAGKLYISRILLHQIIQLLQFHVGYITTIIFLCNETFCQPLLHSMF